MSHRAKKTLCLALGNDILGDDGVSFAVARIIENQFDDVDVIMSSEAGLALLELIEGYENALLLDAIKTGTVPAGTILAFSPEDFQKVIAPSPHYAGLPEVLALAERLEIPMPHDLRILAMEVKDPYVIQEGLTEDVEKNLPAFVESTCRILTGWVTGASACHTPQTEAHHA